VRVEGGLVFVGSSGGGGLGQYHRLDQVLGRGNGGNACLQITSIVMSPFLFVFPGMFGSSSGTVEDSQPSSSSTLGGQVFGRGGRRHSR
jgi:hypothetical protein